MAQPQTLDRNMSDMDRLILRCLDPVCGASFTATRAQAVRRFGERATAGRIEEVARCPVCRSKPVDVSLARPDQVALPPSSDRITFADVTRLGLELDATCAACNLRLEPARQTMVRHKLRPLARLFAERVVVCHKCRRPVCGLAVQRPSREGGGGRETVHAWWIAGSPSDPVVVAFWAALRDQIAREAPR